MSSSPPLPVPWLPFLPPLVSIFLSSHRFFSLQIRWSSTAPLHPPAASRIPVNRGSLKSLACGCGMRPGRRRASRGSLRAAGSWRLDGSCPSHSLGSARTLNVSLLLPSCKCSLLSLSPLPHSSLLPSPPSLSSSPLFSSFSALTLDTVEVILSRSSRRRRSSGNRKGR